jgi:hypothetical protein
MCVYVCYAWTLSFNPEDGDSMFSETPKRWCPPTRLRGVNIQKTESMNNTRRENPKTLKFWKICCTIRGLAYPAGVLRT